MKPAERARWVTLFLLGAWLLVVAWQVDEHHRVVEAAKFNLRVRGREIASTLSAVTRALRFRGAIFQERLDPVLQDLVQTRNSEAARLISVGLLNTDGDPVVMAGDTNLLSHEEIAEQERWSDDYVTFVLSVSGATVSPEGVTNNNPTVVFPPPPRDFTNNEPRRDFPRREPRPGETNPMPGGNFEPTNFPPPPTNAAGQFGPPPMPPDGGGHPRGDRPRGGGGRPFWLRNMSDSDFKALVAKYELHGLVLVLSTDNYRATCTDDLWLRCVIAFFAAVSALGAALAWRNMARTSELQIRLVRASELNSHLKEMNLAAAGLAHETRNPLNIIRGQAQMLSRLPDATPGVRSQAKTIVDEADKVTAQLTEFINYSRPREVRRTRIALVPAASEIVRTLNFDIEEKKLHVEAGGEPLTVEADEQLLRQVLFNLIINAIQAVGQGGNIRIEVRRASPTEAVIEVSDDGPGVAPENRQEIFKPYFTTHQKGTGLGLAVVSQIVLAHGWEIECLGNEPRGALFRITHVKIAA